MINKAVRGAVVAALTTTLALLPTTAAQADSDEDDVEKIKLIGVNAVDTTPVLPSAGDSWVTHQKLYTEKETKGKKKAEFAGDGEAECSAVQVSLFLEEVTAQCTRVLRLKNGTLTLSDMITYRRGEPVTAKTGIIGGTGHYHSAYGDGYITLNGPYVFVELNVDE